MNKKVISLLFGTLIFNGLTPNLEAQVIRATPEFKEAATALKNGQYTKAYESIATLSSNDKYRSQALVEMGRIRQKQAEEEMSKALTHYHDAATLMTAGLEDDGVVGSELPKALYDLARIYEEKLKNYTLAQTYYTKIIEEYPTYMAIDKVYFNLATCEEALGLYEEAAGHFQEVVTNYAYSTYFNAAQEKSRKLSIGTQNEEKAIQSQEEYANDMSETEEGANANLQLGDMQAEAGKYKDAAKAYRQAISEAHDQEEAVAAYLKLVQMQDEKLKDYKQAAETIQEMLEAYPSAKGAEKMVFRMGQIYETDLQSMRKEVIDGKVAYRKSDENSRKAIEFYDTVTDKYPDSKEAADAYLHKARIYEELNETDEAKKTLEKFLREFPHHSEAASVRTRLNDL